MPLVVRAFPLQRSVEELKAFADELRSRSAETDAFYRQFGVSHESWHLQETGHGAWVIGVTVFEDPGEGAARYAKASLAFDTWFKDRVRHLSGVDPDTQPLGPATEPMFSWSDAQVAGSRL